MIPWLLAALGNLAGGVILAILAARMLFPVTPVLERTDSTALPPSKTGPLAEALHRKVAAHAGRTGITPLRNGADAFAARMLLADAAVSSIDAQYYIWHGDLTGYLLLDALQRAAERGVRVRLLLDDNGISGLDAAIATLDAHPNAEVRLYNPFNLRRLKLLSFTFDFFRLNRRMHNKSFTIDGRATIMGGRNIGDEYFGSGPTAIYVDLDVLAVGAVVPEVSDDFDRYWAAPSVHPVGPIVGPPPAATNPIRDGLGRFRGDAQLAEYRGILHRTDFVAALAAGDMDLEWTRAVLVSDDPIKGEGAVPREDLLATRLMAAVGEIRERFDGVSPYFVPGAAGVRAFRTLLRQGVAVRMLTNSLDATDVLPVHAGYSKRRRGMLRCGVVLYEMRRHVAPPPSDTLGPFGSSGSSLHAKTFAVDCTRIFVGSFNFDPRSTTLNTEMGLLIDSETMACALHDAFDGGLAGMAWRVELRGLEKVWVDPETGAEIRDEPGTTALKRAALMVVGWLPVEWLL